MSSVAPSAVALVAMPPARKQSSHSHSSSKPPASAAVANAARSSGGRSEVKTTPSFVTPDLPGCNASHAIVSSSLTVIRRPCRFSYATPLTCPWGSLHDDGAGSASGLGGSSVTTYLSIGEFSQRTRLSPKALRLYGELGLLPPARVDPDSGYRFYREDQIEPARLIGLLRRLDMPLATIRELLPLDGAEAAEALAKWWDGVETVGAERRSLVAYLRARLRGEEQTMYDINVRRLPERRLVSINRHVDAPEHRRVLRRGLQPPACRRPRTPGHRGRAVPRLLRRGERGQRRPDRAVPAGRRRGRGIRRPTSSTASRRRTTRPTSA